jgi:hypothetical protein
LFALFPYFIYKNTMYSTPENIETIAHKIGPSPVVICDMDGCCVIGLKSVVKDRTAPVLSFGTSPETIEEMIRRGILEKAIFVERTMDVRLPPRLVDIVNADIENGGRPRLAFLTSRSAQDAKKILFESGIKNVDMVTLAADSGASLFIDGNARYDESLDEAQRIFLESLAEKARNVLPQLQAIVLETVPGAAGTCPPLDIEWKGIAINLRYRAILEKYQQAEGSPLDQKIAEFLRETFDGQVRDFAPRGDGDAPAFKLVDAPAALEIKIASMDKGIGLASLAKALIADYDGKPSALVFAGDDVAKDGLEGTDWYAMNKAHIIGAWYGVPAYNIHVHHPVGNDLNGKIPDPKKSPSTLSAKFARPDVALTLPTPVELGDFVVRLLMPPATKITRAPEPECA